MPLSLSKTPRAAPWMPILRSAWLQAGQEGVLCCCRWWCWGKGLQVGDEMGYLVCADVLFSVSECM